MTAIIMVKIKLVTRCYFFVFISYVVSFTAINVTRNNNSFWSVSNILIEAVKLTDDKLVVVKR